MAPAKVVKVTDNSKFAKNYGIIDYEGIADSLKSGNTAFVFDTRRTPLKPQTMWKASRKLCVIVGKKVVACKGKYGSKKGYLFKVVEEKAFGSA